MFYVAAHCLQMDTTLSSRQDNAAATSESLEDARSLLHKGIHSD